MKTERQKLSRRVWLKAGVVAIIGTFVFAQWALAQDDPNLRSESGSIRTPKAPPQIRLRDKFQRHNNLGTNGFRVKSRFGLRDRGLKNNVLTAPPKIDLKDRFQDRGLNNNLTTPPPQPGADAPLINHRTGEVKEFQISTPSGKYTYYERQLTNPKTGETTRIPAGTLPAEPGQPGLSHQTFNAYEQRLTNPTTGETTRIPAGIVPAQNYRGTSSGIGLREIGKGGSYQLKNPQFNPLGGLR